MFLRSKSVIFMSVLIHYWVFMYALHEKIFYKLQNEFIWSENFKSDEKNNIIQMNYHQNKIKVIPFQWQHWFKNFDCWVPGSMAILTFQNQWLIFICFFGVWGIQRNSWMSPIQKFSRWMKVRNDYLFIFKPAKSYGHQIFKWPKNATFDSDQNLR